MHGETFDLKVRVISDLFHKGDEVFSFNPLPIHTRLCFDVEMSVFLK
jgi:hypothetical protein